MNRCRKSPRPSLVLALTSIPLLILALLAGGCIDLEPKPDPTRIFVLTGNRPTLPPTGTGNISVGIRRIELPAYLKNPKMATRQGGLEIVYSEFNRWGEGLDKAIGRNLMTALLANPHVSRATLFPSNEKIPPNYSVAVAILRFEGDGSNAAILEARWKILDPKSGEIVQTGATKASRQWNGSDYAALATALSGNLTELAQDISQALDEAAKL